MRSTFFTYFVVFGLGISLGFLFGKKSESGVQMQSQFQTSDQMVLAELPKRSEVKTPPEASEPPQKLDGLEKPKHIVDLEDDFESFMNAGRFEDASQVLKQMEKSNSKSKQYQESLTRYLVRTRDWEKAKEALKYCLAAYPRSKSCLIDMTSAEIQIGALDEIEKAIGDCLIKMPNEPQCRNSLGVHRISGGRFDEAISIYKELIETNGQYNLRFDESMLNWQLGIALEGAKRFEEARNYFEKACRDSYEDACRKL